MQNIDLSIYTNSKNKMTIIKNTNKKTFAVQIKSIFTYYRSIPVEKLAEIVIENYGLLKTNMPTTKITVSNKKIETDIKYLRKIYNALLTKLPNLEFKEMVQLLIHNYTENKYPN